MRNPITATWDYLRGKDLQPTEQKLWYDPILPAIRMGTLVHGPGATDAYDAAWGKGRDGNSAVFACLMALSLAHIEPPLRVFRRGVDRPDWLMDSPLQQFLDNPNPVHDELEIRFWTQWARHLDGNAYLRKIRSGNELTGNVIELWPISPSNVQPVTLKGSSNFIDFYRYTYAPGKYDDIPPENMVHFRVGIDDRDHRKGLSPLKRLMREICSDDEATAFAGSLLENFGVPGLVVTLPKESNMSVDQARDVKATVTAEFRGQGRGGTTVLSPGADMKQFGFSPDQLNLTALHNVPESRICAVMGVHPAIAMLMVGLEQTANYASLKQVRENFTEIKLVPTWRMDAAKLTKQLKPDFSPERDVYVDYDLTDVRALQEDEDAKYKRLDVGVQGFWIKPSEARADTGWADDPELDALWLQRAGQAAAGLQAMPAGKQRVIELKQGEVSAEVLQALVDIAVPDLSERLDTFFDGQRRRVNRALVSG